MKGFKKCIGALTAFAMLLSCFSASGLSARAAEGAADVTVKLRPNEASTFNDTNGDGLGEFEGWGTSLCWWANRIGYDATLTSKAAEVFFGDTGLDMNIGRYNVGGGDLVGEMASVPVNANAVFYDLTTDGYSPTYSGSQMSVSNNTAMTNIAYSASDADFGITGGTAVGAFNYIGWINGLGEEVGSGSNLHYTVNVAEAGNYTVKLLMTLTGTNSNRNVAIKVNDTNEYVVARNEINSNMIASGNNNNLYMVTFSDVAMNAGDNALVIGGKKINSSDDSWTLDFIKMAVIKSGAEGTLPEGDEFTHSPHITRSDSAIPGYATDVTKIVITEEKPLSWYQENFTRADAECGYAWNYDWNADANQMAILKAAAAASGEDFIAEAFSNSPPYFMTYSGCSSGAVNASQDNLRADSYNAFAAYMADVIEYWNKEGIITFQSATPMNEPYTSYWSANSNKQEGCHFDQGESQSKIIVALDRALEEKGIDIILSGTDETSIDIAITSYNKLSDEAKNAISRIDAHTYGGSQRAELRALAEREGKNLWMSEVDGSFTAGTRAGEMSAALGFAQRIMTDVNELKATAWILWNAIDMHVDTTIGYTSDADYTSWDNFNSRVNFNGGYWGITVADHDAKDIVLTKKYYSYGQFSRYIRPGYTIIGSNNTDTLVAYDPEGEKVVVVAVNTAGEDKTWKFDLDSFVTMSDKITAIRTSGSMANGENWADVTAIDNIVADTANKYFTATMKANSITTYIVEGVKYDPNAILHEIASVKDVNIYTVDGLVPSLPATVETVNNGGETVIKNVTWNLEGVDLTQNAEVTGVVEGTDLPAKAYVTYVEENIQYFIDCNSPNSPAYLQIDSYADLYNEIADQAYTEGSWGYMDVYGDYNGEVSDIYDCGWWAKSGQTIQYTVPLKAGTYSVDFGFKEWWRDSTKSRSMGISMTVDGTTTALGTSNTWEDSNWWNRDTYEITLEADAEVTFNVAKNKQGDPVLSFIQIQNVLDVAELKDAIAASQEIDRSLYPAARVEAVDQAVAKAADLLVKAATTQEQVNEGAEALRAAIDALDDITPAADKSVLQTLLDEAAQLNKEDYTEESWEKFQTALENAENVNGSEAATQEEVDAAAAALTEAEEQLEKIAEKPDEKPEDKPQNPGGNNNTGNGSSTGNNNNGQNNTTQEDSKKTEVVAVDTGDKNPIGLLTGVGIAVVLLIGACIVLKRRMGNNIQKED